MSSTETSTHRVLRVERLDTDLFFLAIERNDLSFDPGDCVVLHTADGNSRPYSIASGKHANELRFLVREQAGGRVSPWLSQRKPGDTIQVSPPFGWFRPGQHPDDSPSVFIATGTGIAPFLSFRETFFAKPPQAILYGVRKTANAAGLDRLSDWSPVQLAVSRECDPDHHHGRVTDLLDGLSVPDGTHYYLCGLERMINQVTEQLEARGVGLHQIHREVFFHD